MLSGGQNIGGKVSLGLHSAASSADDPSRPPKKQSASAATVPAAATRRKSSQRNEPVALALQQPPKLSRRLTVLSNDYARVNTALKTWRSRIWRNVLGIEEIEQPVEEVEVNFVRYRPETLQQLCKLTKFSKKELQLMYRGFKEGCPTGLVTLEQFKEIYSCFFPQGDSSKYATYIFNTFDRDKNGEISFDEFVMGLSVLSRGSEEEKLRWVFNLYDIDNDGYLTRDNIETILFSIYDMMGPNTDPPIKDDTIKNHVDAIFSKMDDNQDGLITLQEFLHNCKNDISITKSLHLFDTVFMTTSISSVSSAMRHKLSSN